MKKKYIFRNIILLVLMVMTVCFSIVFSTEAEAASFSNTTLTPKTQDVNYNSVTLKWNKVSGASGYVVWKRTPGSKWGKYIKKITNNSTTTYKVSGLKFGQTYQFAIRGYKKQNGKYVYTKYKYISLKTQMANVTAKISNASTSSRTQIKVTWNRVGGAQKYRIWRRKIGGSWSALGNVSSGTSAYIDYGMATGTSYQYCVRGYAKVNGKGVYSKLIVSNTLTTPSSSKLTTEQKNVIKKILYAVESGGQVYGSQNYSAFAGVAENCDNETAITIGAGQWYGVEAKKLLQLIQTRYSEKFKQLDTAGIANDLVNADWSTYGVTKSSKKGKCIINIISSAEGIACQDSLMISQIESMESTIRKITGANAAEAVAECINMYHQGGLSAVLRVLAKAKQPYTLENIYAALSTDTGNQVGAYKSRQKAVYEMIKAYL